MAGISATSVQFILLRQFPFVDYCAAWCTHFPLPLEGEEGNHNVATANIATSVNLLLNSVFFLTTQQHLFPTFFPGIGNFFSHFSTQTVGFWQQTQAVDCVTLCLVKFKILS